MSRPSRRGRARGTARQRIPWPFAVAAAGGLALFTVPFVALLAEVPWARFGTVLAQSAGLPALRLSVLCATAATALCLVLGVPLAWVLARGGLPGTGAVRAFVTLPMVLPPVVGGVALLLAFGRRGLLGQWLDRWWGVQIPYTTVAVVLAEAFVALPFLVVSVESALRAGGTHLEEAAATLGAGPWQVLWRVTLPTTAPAIGAGAVLAWARALGEFGATVTLAGNLPGVTQTMPLAVYQAMEVDPDAAVTLSTVLVGVCVVVLVLLRWHWLAPVLGRAAGTAALLTSRPPRPGADAAHAVRPPRAGAASGGQGDDVPEEDDR